MLFLKAADRGAVACRAAAPYRSSFRQLRHVWFAQLTLVVALFAAVSAFAPSARSSGSDQILFTRYVFSASAQDTVIMNAGGSGQTTLTTLGVDSALSPDGTKIAFDGAGYIYWTPVDDSDQTDMTLVTDGGSTYDQYPSWSPDGTKVAFLRFNPTSNDIYVANADGTGLRTVITDVEALGPPAWSPDGSKLAFTRWTGSHDDIYSVDLDGDGATNLTAGSGVDNQYPTWSPDGQQIAFTRSAGNIWTMNADGSGSQDLGVAGVYESWGGGGKIAFVDSENLNTIYTMNGDGSGVTQLTDPIDGYVWWPSWGDAAP